MGASVLPMRLPWASQPHGRVYADPAHWSTKHLVAWLPGNGFYYDASPYRRLMQTSGNPQFAFSTKTDANNPYGWTWAKAVDWDGSDDEALIEGFPHTPEVTCCAWVFNKQTGVDSYATLIGRGDVFDSNVSFAFGLRTEIAGRNRIFMYARNVTTLVGAESSNLLTSFNLSWHFIAGTLSASECALYLDNTARETFSGGAGTDAGYPLRFGAGSLPAGSSIRYNAPAFDMRVYNRALSAAQVQRIYNEGPWALFEPQTLWRIEAGAPPVAAPELLHFTHSGLRF